jgi:azurin
VDAGLPQDLFLTVHKLGPPFTAFPGYQAKSKVVAAHPMLVDLASDAKAAPNPWRKKLRGVRSITIEAGKNLSFFPRSFTAHPGERLQLTFINPDVVPHNWVLVLSNQLESVGQLVDRSIVDPDAVGRQYVPKTDAVLAYTDIVPAGQRFTIYFAAPREKGRYPFLCTFPGHWMVMNGQMVVE